MSIYRRNGSPYWYFSYTINGQKLEGSIKTASKKLARPIAATKKAELLRNGEIEVIKRMPLPGLADKFLEWSKANKKSYVRDTILVSHLLKFFREPEKNFRWFPEDEIAKFLKACDDRIRSIFLVGINTGMRIGEIFNLRWNDIDFENKYITVQESKTDEYRKVKMNAVVISALNDMEVNGGYIFPNSGGEPYKRINKAFKNTCNRAGIKPATPHAMRHTFASHLMKRGVDPYTIMELGGWKSLEMVMRYSHLAPDHKQIAVNKLAEMECQKIS